MPSKTLQQQMYGLTGKSTAQRTTLAALLGLWAAVACWILLGGGLSVVGSWFGVPWETGNILRREVLAAAFCIYFVRVLFTTFVFLRRGMSWSEVFTITPWVLFIFLFLGIAGGCNATEMGLAGGFGAAAFLFGSWMNTWAEYSRHVWKQKPENKGKLYTLGLFALSRHPNYLGDLLSFSGLCLFAGRWYTGVVPLTMMAGFVFVNIPVLDAHLQAHYGEQFIAYAKSTRKLIPFLY